MNTLNALFDSKFPADHLNALYLQGVLRDWLPEVHALYNVPQSPAHHPEVDTGVHIELCIKVAAQLKVSRAAFIAVLLHDLGKGLTPKNEWPKHVNHESSGVPLVRDVACRLGLTNYEGAVSEFVCEYHLHAHRLLDMSVKGLIRFADQVFDAVSQHGSVFEQDFIDACECDKRGRAGLEDTDYAQKRFFVKLMNALRQIEHMRCIQEEPPSTQWVSWHTERLHAVTSLKKSFV